MPTEEAEVQRLRRRDAEAFARLWSAQQGRLFSIASAALGDGERAEAALRQTIEWAWADCEQVAESPGRWLVEVCARVLLSPEFQAGSTGGRAGGERGRVMQVLSGLSGEDRTLLVLHHLGGLEAGELARVTQKDARTIRLAIQRGRCALVELAEGSRVPPKTCGRHAGLRSNNRGGSRVSNHPGSRRRGRFSLSGAGAGPLRHR